MYEELIKALRCESLYSEKATLEIMDLCMNAAQALETQAAQLAAKDAEIERLLAVNNIANINLEDWTMRYRLLQETSSNVEAENDRLHDDLARVTEERDAATELIGKLDRCVMLLSVAEKSLAPNPAVRHAIHFAVNAIENWRTPAKQDEEG